MLALLLGRFLTAGAPGTEGPAAATDDPDALTRTGIAAIAQARATADPAWYARAEDALTRARALAPDDATALVGLGQLATARHDFAEALTLGRQAHALAPSSTALGVVVDALVETGRYDEAAVEVDRMVALRPDVASLARVSYLQQLGGDTGTAVVTMQQAVSAAGPTGPDAAYVRTLLGDLHLGEGRVGRARSAYASAQEAVADWPAAEYGLARADAAAGDLPAAADRLGELVLRLPLPDHAAVYGDVLTRLGRPDEAAEQYGLVRVQQDLEASQGGVVVDVESARFEADRAHDARPADAAALVDAALQAQRSRPTVFADDAVAWSLHAAGRTAEALPWVQRATRLGTRDAVLWYHRAVVEDALGRRADATRSLALALDITPAVSVRDEPAARALAARLGVPVPAVSTR